MTVPRGDCYSVAAEIVLDWPGDASNIRVCHGTVWHERIGWHGHAWVEVWREVAVMLPELPSGVCTFCDCIDKSNGRDVEVPWFMYYKAGRVKDVHRYTQTQTRTMMRLHETFGPWTDAREAREEATDGKMVQGDVDGPEPERS